GLDGALFEKLAEGSWIDAHDNLILCELTGVGKSWLASALGHKACRDNRSVLYQRIPKLFADLALARGDGRYARIQRAACSCSSSTTGVSSPSTPPPATTSLRFAKNATADGRRSSPAKSPSTNGTSSSATPPTPTPSSIASSTTPTASLSPATACDAYASASHPRID